MGGGRLGEKDRKDLSFNREVMWKTEEELILLNCD